MPKFFVTHRDDYSITPVEAVEVAPRYILVMGRDGNRKRKARRSFMHQYHESFEKARAWLRTANEIAITRADRHLRTLLSFRKQLEERKEP